MQKKQYKNFALKRSLPIKELQCELKEYVHLPTGAEILHIANDDPENAFCLSFRTYPETSNGVAHILEHTVLCGSEKFPVKDPFFMMIRRSLQTYMNAWTGADFTCYPAASQVKKDFYNLLEVYLDAAFAPNLKELSFLQEGHRLEFTEAENTNSPLTYKGIVFNEMKGALASPSTRLIELLNQTLFPDLTYGINSGGDPAVIPELTYEEFLEFHHKFYHPSRCLFFFYGNLPIEGHLDFLAEKLLYKTEKKEQIPHLTKQERFKEPRFVKGEYPISPTESTKESTLYAMGWLTCPILEQETLLALNILEMILMNTDASPLKKALLQSGLCKQASSYLDGDCSEAPFVLFLQGCEEAQSEKIRQFIQDSLKKIASQGIPEEAIESALHQLEFSRSEITGEPYPFGLSLFIRSGLQKQHGANPEEGLLIHSLFATLRAHLKRDPNYLTSLLKKYLIDNPHAVVAEMQPSTDLAQKEQEKERAQLDAIQKLLSDQEKNKIIATTKELADFQKKQEEQDKDILPKITLTDIPKETRDYTLTQKTWKQYQVYHHDCFTNNILYAELSFPLSAVTEKELPYLSLLTSLLPQLGSGGRNYRENLEYIEAHTGGISASISLNVQAEDSKIYAPILVIQGKALSRNARHLFTLMRDLVESCDLTDEARIEEIIQKQNSSLQLSLSQRGLSYASSLATSSFSSPSKIGNELHGLPYFTKVRSWAKKEEKNLLETLQTLQKKVLCFSKADLVLTCEKEMLEKAEKENFWGLDQIPVQDGAPWIDQFSLSSLPPQGRVIPSPVAFTSTALPTISYTHPDTSALAAAAHLFNNLTLHPKLREQGGAYGGGSTHNSLAGHFTFWAYRDPNLSRTLLTFEEAIEHLLSGDFSEEQIEEAKREVIQKLDNPISPGSRGSLAHSWLLAGTTKAVRQAFRDRLLSLTKEEIIEAVRTHLAPQIKQGMTVSLAGKELLERENVELTKHSRTPLTISDL